MSQDRTPDHHHHHHHHHPQRIPLEDLLGQALLTSELEEAELPHVVIAEIGPAREQVLIGPCRNGLDALLASVTLEQELRREFADREVRVRVAPLHPASAWPHVQGRR